MFESCVEIRAQFTDYLDSRCDREQLRSVRFHLTYCEACRQELCEYRKIQAELAGLPKRRVPPEVRLRLRVRMSQELHRNLLGRLSVRLENFFRPVLLPASGGVLTAIIFFGLIIGSQAVPAVIAPDVPLQLATPPRVRSLAPINFNTEDQAIVVVTQVDAGGRAVSYYIISGHQSPELLHDLDRLIYFSLFDPATTFGKPTNGQVVLSLRRITVRG